MIDRKIADELGIHKTAVRKRRMILGLKANGHKRLFTDEQFIELHEQGFNDNEISEKLGASSSTVRERRMKLGLKAKSRRLFTDQQLIELHKKGMIDREIGEKLGAHQNTINRHRRRLGLKANGRKRTKAVIRPARKPVSDDTPHGWYVEISRALQRRFRVLIKFIARVLAQAMMCASASYA